MKGFAADRDVLLTGASSQLGQVLLPALLSRGFSVEAWSRNEAAGQTLFGARWQCRDITRPGEAPSSPIIVHLAPLWLLPAWLEAHQPKGKRIVAIGSCSITAKAGSPSAQERELAARLQLAEQRLAELAARDGHGLTILRPTMLYGIGRDSTIAPMQNFIRRWGFLPFPALKFGLRQPVHVADVAEAVAACLETPRSIGHTYEIGGAERLPLDELARRLFTDNGRPVRVLPIPKGMLAMLLRLRALITGNTQWDSALLERASLDQTAEIEAARRDFNYSPRRFDGRFPDKP